TRSGDQRAQFTPRHRTFNLASGLPAQRSMMDGDGKVVFVGVPQLLKDVLGQKARIGEHQCGAVGLDKPVKLRNSPYRGMATPRHPLLFRQQYLHLWWCALFPADELHRVDIAPWRQPAPEGLGISDSRG